MSTQHTPGPWTAAGLNQTRLPPLPLAVGALENGQNKAICSIFGFSDEDKANARLIAEAPSLLGALQLAWQALPDAKTEVLPVVRAVITKACGSGALADDDATSRLIAAAPDLLAALKRAVNCIDPIGNLRRLSPVEEATAKQGREAIARAEEGAVK